MDSMERIWFGEYRGNRIAMFDTRTQRFQEWNAPYPWTAPYDAELAKDGAVWSTGITTDRVLKLDPDSGKIVKYLLPRYSSVRRVFVDNSTTPVTIWMPNKNNAAILRLEPLD